MVGYFLALGVDKLTGAGLVDQQSSFLGLLSLHVVVFAVLLFPTIDRIQVRNWRCGRGRCFSLRSQSLREAFAARRRLCRAVSSPSTASRRDLMQQRGRGQCYSYSKDVLGPEALSLHVVAFAVLLLYTRGEKREREKCQADCAA